MRFGLRSLDNAQNTTVRKMVGLIAEWAWFGSFSKEINDENLDTNPTSAQQWHILH